MKRDGQATRQHILVISERIFAEQGFDAARVDRIAKDAGVNKALIYYYFDSKQAILDELIDDFINTANSFLISMFHRGVTYGSENMKELMVAYEEYLLGKDHMLRLVLTESMKDSYEVPPIFRLIDFNPGNFDEKEIVGEMNRRGFGFDEDADQRKVTEFFTGIMPTVIFSLFRSRWCSHFGVEPEDLKMMFARACAMTHERHHEEG